MAKDAQSAVIQAGVPSPVAAQHFVPPTARELRAQAVHRLQVGLFGLATMLLLVGLANSIMDRARQSDALSGVTQESAGASAGARDPLADIGVVPAAEPTVSPEPTGGR